VTEQLPVRRYCSAGGVVLDSSGEYMLVLVRPGRTGLDCLPEVRLPKCHIEPDESRPQAALREAWEEAGLPQLNILADLGHQTVEFDWKGYHST
jgi:8-oxo-dGTP pyrophosphatase MutT (NUDIX family)